MLWALALLLAARLQQKSSGSLVLGTTVLAAANLLLLVFAVRYKLPWFGEMLFNITHFLVLSAALALRILLPLLLFSLFIIWRRHRPKQPGREVVIHFEPDRRQLVVIVGPLVIWLMAVLLSKAFLHRPIDPIFMLGLLVVPLWMNGRYWFNRPDSRNAIALVRLNAVALGAVFLALWFVQAFHLIASPGGWRQYNPFLFAALAMMFFLVASLVRQKVTLWQALFLSAGCAFILVVYGSGRGLYFRYFGWGPDGPFFTGLVIMTLCILLIAAQWAARGEGAKA